MTQNVTILGSPWTVQITTTKCDKLLETRDGYCDKTSKRIVVCDLEDDCNLDNFIEHRKKVLRHELLHAFLFESGLGECFEHKAGHDETFIDWFAIQSPKFFEVCQYLNCL